MRPNLGIVRSAFLTTGMLAASFGHVERARAVVVFGDIGPAVTSCSAALMPDNCINQNGQVVTGTASASLYGISPSQSLAVAFTPSANYTLSDIQLPLLDYAPYTGGGFNVYLTNGLGSGATVLESFLGVATTPITVGGNFTSPEVYTSTTNPLLSSGTTYWVEVTPATSTSNTIWLDADTTVAFSNGSDYAASATGAAGTWNLQGPDSGLAGLIVDGTLAGSSPPTAATPEPGSVGLFGIALAAIGALRRRRTGSR